MFLFGHRLVLVCCDQLCFLLKCMLQLVIFPFYCLLWCVMFPVRLHVMFPVGLHVMVSYLSCYVMCYGKLCFLLGCMLW